MVWEERLFAFLDDLEQQAEGAFQEQREAEIADRGQREYAAVSLASRLMASVGREVSLQVTGVGRLDARLDRVADGWCLLGHPDGVHEWIVRLPAIQVVDGCSERSVPEIAWPVTARLGFGYALRRIASDGDRCGLHLLDGGTLDARPVRVGADFVEVDAGDPDRPTTRRTLTLVAHHAIAVVRRLTDPS